ncbi:hypothetical protein [Streptomyces buecherae]|uniref:hypothetical protein n=1 Tax=Streptomyces buecherae TaxID=2763006 RepID=UPI003665F546
MAKHLTPRRAATWYPVVDDRRGAGRPITAHRAAAEIRRARRQPAEIVDAIHVYATTDRTGDALHIGYIHYTPGHWTDVADVIDIYEIPTAALTDI